MRCALVLLPALVCSLTLGCASPEPKPVPPERIILVCLDALRYDRIGSPVVPRLNRFASESTQFTRCYTAGSWTKPSITALFTGKWATHAGVFGRFDNLPEEETTLAEVFRDSGWDTVAVSANIIVRSEKGFGQGFDEFRYDLNARADKMVDTALQEIEKRRDHPFLMYVHLMDTHEPLAPPEPHLSRWRRGEGRYRIQFADVGDLVFGDLELTEGEVEQIRGLYDAEAAFADEQIGRLIDTLIEWELWEGTEFVFFADHGEELGDHGDWTHGHCLYNEVAQIPLIMRLPGGHEQKNDELTSLSSLGGMMFESAGIEAPPQFTTERPCYIEGVKRGGEQKCIITDDGWKLIWRVETDVLELYDLTSDPDEQINLVEDMPEMVDELFETLRSVAEGASEREPETYEPTQQELEELRALGYVQ